MQISFNWFVHVLFHILAPIYSKDQQGARLDAFLHALNNFTEKYAGDSSGSQHQAGQSSVHMHVPALMNGSVNGPVDGSSTDGLGNNNEDAELQEGIAGPRTLAEFEEQAFKKLSAKASGKCKALKRPAAAASATVSSQKASPKASSKKTVKSKNGWKPSAGVYGCLRCRGNIAGCSTCWSPLFNGQRFSSREEWKKFMAKLELQKKNKKCQQKKK